jgi:hypothetical protein
MSDRKEASELVTEVAAGVIYSYKDLIDAYLRCRGVLSQEQIARLFFAAGYALAKQEERS